MKRKYIIWTVIIIVVVFIGLRLFANKQRIDKSKEITTNKSITIPVRVAEVSKTPINQKIVKTGNLIANKHVEIALPLGGVVEQIRFELGDKVRKGAVLAVVDSKMNQLELEKNNIKLEKLKNDLEVYKELYEGKAATREKLTEVQQTYDEAVNQMQQLRQQISDATVTAPISGIMASKLLEEGAYASTGAKIGEIVDLSSTRVEVSLTESEAYEVEEGQEVKITTNVYPGKEFKGELTFISPQADQAHNYMAEVSLNVPKDVLLRAGTFVYVDFSRTLNEKILSVPREALIENMESVSVYVKEGDVAKLQPVVTGREVDGKVEILEGLSDGEVVITAGQVNLKDGVKISVSN